MSVNVKKTGIILFSCLIVIVALASLLYFVTGQNLGNNLSDIKPEEITKDENSDITSGGVSGSGDNLGNEIVINKEMLNFDVTKGGTFVLHVVLLNFKDCVNYTKQSVYELNLLFNDNDFSNNTTSVYEYYYLQSNGKLSIVSNIAIYTTNRRKGRPLEIARNLRHDITRRLFHSLARRLLARAAYGLGRRHAVKDILARRRRDNLERHRHRGGERTEGIEVRSVLRDIAAEQILHLLAARERSRSVRAAVQYCALFLREVRRAYLCEARGPQLTPYDALGEARELIRDRHAHIPLYPVTAADCDRDTAVKRNDGGEGRARRRAYKQRQRRQKQRQFTESLHRPPRQFISRRFSSIAASISKPPTSP